METAKEWIEQALSDFVERETGVRPAWKPSKRAHCATSAFLRADARAAAERLHAARADCTLFGAPLVNAVRKENGWILMDLTAEAVDALAERLPPAEEPDETVFLRRLWIWAQQEERPTPSDPVVLQGVYGVLFGAADAENLLLKAPQHLDGMARVTLEQGLSRAAKVLLWERRKES